MVGDRCFNCFTKNNPVLWLLDGVALSFQAG
jgi:hypothetical protein